ncbi:MAG: amidase [Bacteroidota bacterium]
MKIFNLILVIVLSFFLGAFTFYFSEGLTRNEAHTAAKTMGLQFTDAEIDSLLPDIEEYQEAYQKNREAAIPNGLSPAIIFNPVPPGFKIPTEQQPIRWAKPRMVKMPAMKEDLAFYSIADLGYLLRTKQTTSVELTRFFLDRLKKYNNQLHFAITITEELAIKQAKKADELMAAGTILGPLHGIPYGAKDLLAVKGYKTTWGAMPYKDQMIDMDATVIQKLEAAGAVLCAKTTLGALAWGDVWYDETTRNPWNPETGSSGSSAGSASTVAAGCLPFAIGTETLGSIVSPSTVCGTTGLRPTFGQVSRHGAMALSWTMDKIGPICRTVEDCAMVYEAIRGIDGQDNSLIPSAFNYDTDQDINTLKIGYVKADFEKDYGFKENDSLALNTLRELGIELIPIELPPLPDIRFILTAEAAAAFDELTRSGKDDLLVRQIKNAWPNTFRAARFIPAVEYIQANRLRSQLIKDMASVFEKVDVFVAPSWASRSLTITNLTGHPAVVVPNGFRDGMPTSITFTGQLFGDAATCTVAKAFQDATDFHKKHPVLD